MPAKITPAEAADASIFPVVLDTDPFKVRSLVVDIIRLPEVSVKVLSTVKSVLRVTPALLSIVKLNAFPLTNLVASIVWAEDPPNIMIGELVVASRRPVVVVREFNISNVPLKVKLFVLFTVRL